MAFEVALEDEGFVRARVDTEPFIQAINSAKESGRVLAITLPADEVTKTKGTLQRCASAMEIGLRWDTDRVLDDGRVKIRFRTAEKRKHSPEAVAKRKATMLKNGTTAGRKKAAATTTASGKKAS